MQQPTPRRASMSRCLRPSQEPLRATARAPATRIVSTHYGAHTVGAEAYCHGGRANTQISPCCAVARYVHLKLTLSTGNGTPMGSGEPLANTRWRIRWCTLKCSKLKPSRVRIFISTPRRVSMLSAMLTRVAACQHASAILTRRACQHGSAMSAQRSVSTRPRPWWHGGMPAWVRPC